MYGTVAGVKTKAKQYTQIFDRQNDYLDIEITNALLESSMFADQILSKRYDLSTIQANAPNLVTEYAELRAYIIILTQISQIDGASYPAETISQIEKRIQFIEEILYNGGLLDNNSAMIDYTVVSELIALTLLTEEDA
jgi:hypothetical protein